MRACGVDADADGRGDDEGFVEAAGASDALEGLHDFADADGETIEGELGPGIERIGSEGALAPLRIGDVVVGLLGVGAGEVRRGWGGVFCDVDGEDRIGDARRGIDGAACDAVLPLVSGAAFQPHLLELVSRVVACEAWTWTWNCFAGRDAAWRLSSAEAPRNPAACAWASLLRKAIKIEAERVAERGLKLIDLGIEFEEEPGFASCIEIACGNLLAKSERLAIDRSELLCDRKAGIAWALRLELLNDRCRSALSPLESHSGAGAFTRCAKPATDVSMLTLAVVEEAAVRADDVIFAGRAARGDGP